MLSEIFAHEILETSIALGILQEMNGGVVIYHEASKEDPENFPAGWYIDDKDYTTSSMDTKVPNILERHKKENKNIISVIYAQFDDIDSCTEVHGEIPMMQSDAKHIVDGIEHNINRIQQIIVHCDAGYSRSPAIAAAIAKAFGMDDEEYFSGGRYCPNRHVYRTMLNEFAERGYFD